MGLANIVSTVLTKYKADTSDQRKGLKKLQGEEKKRHKALLDQTEKQNEKLDGHIKMWGKVAVGIGAATVAAKVLSDGLDKLQKNSALRAATVGVSLEGLRKSTVGLVADTRLLEFASKAMNGTFKLSQKEMEQALAGATALRKTLGVELPVALKAMQKAITEGTTEPLKELGLVIKGPENDTEEGLQAALQALNAEAESLGGNFGLAGDEIAQAGASMENSMDSLGESFGRVAEAMSPLISGFAKLLELATDFQIVQDAVRGLSYSESLEERGGSKAEILAAKIAETGDEGAKLELQKLLASELAANRAASFGASIKANQASRAKRLTEAGSAAFAQGKDIAIKSSRRGGGDGGGDTSDLGGQLGGLLDSLIGQLGGDDQGMTRFLKNMTEKAAAAVAAQDAASLGALEDGSALAEAEASLGRITDAADAANGNILEQLFGTPTEIDETALALESLSTGVDAFAGAFGQGVGALIDGSESFSNAFKDALGQSLKAMAIDFSMQALRHTLYGIGAAIWNPAAAGAHFAAAGAFAAGAVTVGGVASQFGVNSAAPAQVSTGTGGGAFGDNLAGTSGVGNLTPQGAANGNTTVNIFDDDFASLSARQRESLFRSRAGAAGFTVEGAVVENG